MDTELTTVELSDGSKAFLKSSITRLEFKAIQKAIRSKTFFDPQEKRVKDLSLAQIDEMNTEVLKSIFTKAILPDQSEVTDIQKFLDTLDYDDEQALLTAADKVFASSQIAKKNAITS